MSILIDLAKIEAKYEVPVDYGIRVDLVACCDECLERGNGLEFNAGIYYTDMDESSPTYRREIWAVSWDCYTDINNIKDDKEEEEIWKLFLQDVEKYCEVHFKKRSK